MEIRTLQGIKEMENIIEKIKEHLQEECKIDMVLYEIYDNYIEKVYNIILEGVNEGELYNKQAGLFNEILSLRKILYWKYRQKK